MGLFDKREKQLKKELVKKNIAFCREVVKELEELHDDLRTAYSSIEDSAAGFYEFKGTLEKKLSADDTLKIDEFAKRFKKADKLVRDAIRDIRDVLRNQKKRLRESTHDE